VYTTESQKEEFLKEYFRSRVVSTTMVKAVMNRALGNERIFGKPFYDFTKENIIEMYSAAKTKSSRTLQNWNLTLKHASAWFLHGQGKPIDSAYSLITKLDLEQCIDETAVKQMLVSRADLSMMQDDLMNATDKAILEMLFLGFGGESLRELTFFTPTQMSYQEQTVYFRSGKVIPITERSYNIIKEGCEETSLVSYGEEMRVIKVSGSGVYKVRGNTVNNNDNPDDADDLRRRFRFIHRRVNLVSEYFDIPMTPKSLNASGFWHFAHQDMATNDISDFREYLATDDAKKLCWRYGFTGDHYMTTVLDKFRRYL
jgi:hypothetical protein